MMPRKHYNNFENMLIFQYKTNILGVEYIQYGQNTKQQNVYTIRSYQKLKQAESIEQNSKKKNKTMEFGVRRGGLKLQVLGLE